MYRVTLRVLICIAILVGVVFSVTACNREPAPLPAETAVQTVPTQPETLPPTEETQPATEEPTVPATEAQPEIFTLTFAGDCTLGTNEGMYYAPWGFIKLVGEDYGYPFRNVMAYFGTDDFTMVNLEGPLCDSGNPVVKKHTFHGPTDYVRILTENSVEAVTLANNHTLDYGKKGYESTIATLDGAAMPYVKENESLLITTERGLTIGIYAAWYNTWDMEDLKEEVAQLRENGAQIVVYAVHWGTEGSYRPEPNQVNLAHEIIDAGVDIIYGSHPHVLQSIEAYNGGIIYYSLGNFAFGGNMYPDDLDTAIVQQQVIRWPDGTVELGELTRIPCSVSSMEVRNNFQPTPLEPGTEAYDRVLSKLDGSFTGPNLRVS